MWDNSLNHHLIYNFVSHSVSHDFIIAGMQPTNRFFFFFPLKASVCLVPKKALVPHCPTDTYRLCFYPGLLIIYSMSGFFLLFLFCFWFFFSSPSHFSFPSPFCVEVASLSAVVCAGACSPSLQEHLGMEVSQTHTWAVLLLSTVVCAVVKRDKWHEHYQWEHTRNCYLLLSSSSQKQQYL